MNRGPAKQTMGRAATAVSALLAAVIHLAPAATAQDAVARGKYLVGIAGCNDCHTPGYFLGKPDMARYLGGSEVGFEVPGLGVFHGPNLTPDKDTGLGGWTDEQVIAAVTQGKHPSGRELAPVMPWHAFATLTPDDQKAIVAFLRTIPAVSNKVPGPFGPSEKPTGFILRVVPPQQ